MEKLAYTLLLSLCLVACSTPQKEEAPQQVTESVPPEEQNVLVYFTANGIDLQNSSIILLNPDFCGACTEETMDWIVNQDQVFNGKKFILTTAEIPAEHLTKINTTSFIIIMINGEDVGRLGIPETASTHFLLKNNRIELEEIIK